jgi:hypothetical protein
MSDPRKDFVFRRDWKLLVAAVLALALVIGVIAMTLLLRNAHSISAVALLGPQAQKMPLSIDNVASNIQSKYVGGLHPGSEDTELGVLMEPEVGHGETEVYPRVQA